MKNSFELGVIGGGFMASAILEGVLKNKLLAPEQICVSDLQVEKLQYLQSQGVYTTDDNAFVAKNSKYVMFAVKPQTFPAVAEQLGEITINNAISIMAGVTKDAVKNAVGAKKVARAMPNLPCSVGAGMVGVDTSDFEKDEQLFILNLFQSTGKVEEVDETLLNAVTGVSGSGPAYVYLFLKSLAEAGEKFGLPKEKSLNFALQTLKGGVKLVEDNPTKSLDDLIAAVSSKGGTTVAALTSFEKDDWSNAVTRAVGAAIKRAQELSK